MTDVSKSSCILKCTWPGTGKRITGGKALTFYFACNRLWFDPWASCDPKVKKVHVHDQSLLVCFFYLSHFVNTIVRNVYSPSPYLGFWATFNSTQGSLLMVLGVPDGVPGIEPGPTACKTSTLPAILSLEPHPCLVCILIFAQMARVIAQR